MNLNRVIGWGSCVVGLLALVILASRLWGRELLPRSFIFWTLPQILFFLAWVLLSGRVKLKLALNKSIAESQAWSGVVSCIIVGIMYFSTGPIPVFQPAESAAEIGAFAIWLFTWLIVDFSVATRLLK